MKERKRKVNCVHNSTRSSVKIVPGCGSTFESQPARVAPVDRGILEGTLRCAVDDNQMTCVLVAGSEDEGSV